MSTIELPTSTTEHAEAIRAGILKLGRAGFTASASGIWIAVKNLQGVLCFLAPDQVDTWIAHNWS